MQTGDKFPVGVFDTGIGGLYVLRHAMQRLPHEQFVYYADLKNAPYGDRTVEEIARLSVQAVDFLVKKGIKALVVACNTATSGAIELLRERHDFPVIGMEPAIRPALQQTKGYVAVMATAATLELPKFKQLLLELDTEGRVIPVACPGLSRLIERETPGSPEIGSYLRDLLAEVPCPVEAVVIGCTHYSFIIQDIREVLGPVAIVDGTDGAIRQLDSQLQIRKIAADGGKPGGVEMFSSSMSPEDDALLRRYLTIPVDPIEAHT